MNSEIQTLAASVTKIELQVRIRFLKLMLSTQNTDKFVSLLDQYLIRFPLNQFSETAAPAPLAKTPALPQKPTDSAPESQPKMPPQIQKLTAEDRRTIRRSLTVFATAELLKPASPERLNFLNRLLSDPLKALSRTKNSSTIFNHPRLGKITAKIIRESVVKTPPPIKLPHGPQSANTPRKSRLPKQVPSKSTVPVYGPNATSLPGFNPPPQDSIFPTDSSAATPLLTPSSVPTQQIESSPKGIPPIATPTPSTTSVFEMDQSVQKMHAFILRQDKASLHGFTPMQAANYLSKLQKMDVPEFQDEQSKFSQKESALSTHYFSKTGFSSLKTLGLSEDFFAHKALLASFAQKAKK